MKLNHSLIETKEICSYLGITPETLKRYVNQYPQMPVKKFGGRYKANPDDLKEFVRKFLSTPEVFVNTARSSKGSRAKKKAIPPPGGWQVKDPSERDK